ncbi:MAG TPA: hypothetical protein EYP69_05860 [Bacteroidales bacterium]|nr:hypothetical protein [Bacteroidales bacterium]
MKTIFINTNNIFIMIKKLFFAAVVAFTFAACNNDAEKADASKELGTDVLTVDQLEMTIEDLVGKTVVVAGDVDHVCKHGGTKMVILGDSTDIHIKATDESGNFRADEVMDHRVIVTGEVDEFRIDEDYIEKKEAELEDLIANKEDEQTEEDEEDGYEHEEKGVFPDNDSKHKKEISGLKKQIESLKAMLEEAKAEGKDHVSFYSVKANSYEIDPDAEVKSEQKAFDDGPAEMASDEEDKKAAEDSTNEKE